MRSKMILGQKDVQIIVAAAKAEATRNNIEATIAVCDDSGHLLYLERSDSQRVNSVEMSTEKARTAALRARPSSALAKRVEEGRVGFLKQPNCLPITGGVPIFYRKVCVGGIGVSGVSKLDEPIAQAGADALPQE
jgi:glc operon protein GlcG